MQQGNQGLYGHAPAMKIIMEGKNMSLWTTIDALFKKVEGVTQADVDKLKAEAAAELEKVKADAKEELDNFKADVQGAVADAKATVQTTLEKYGPEVKQAVMDALNLVEQAVQNILASHV